LSLALVALCTPNSPPQLKLLCQGPGDHTSEQQQQQQAVAATPGGVDSQAAAAGAVPAPVVGYPHLVELDLTGSCVAPGITINIEALQGSCPALEVLSLEGVGGFYGGRVGGMPGARRVAFVSLVGRGLAGGLNWRGVQRRRAGDGV
jgi:hypothetical protein